MVSLPRIVSTLVLLIWLFATLHTAYAFCRDVMFNMTHVCIPAVEELFNISYMGKQFLVLWQGSSCLYIVVYDAVTGNPTNAYFTLYGLDENGTLYLITTIVVNGSYTYCNMSLEGYKGVAVVMKMPDNTLLGPILVLKPEAFVSWPPFPGDLSPWLPLILVALVIYIVIYFNLRKMLAGLIAFVAFTPFIASLFTSNPIVIGTVTTLAAVLAGILWYVLQKYPEGGE